MVDLFGELGRKAIDDYVKSIAEDNDNYKKLENLRELAAAKSIIMNFLGDRWWNLAGKELQQKQNIEGISKEKLGPISAYLDKKPQSHVKLVHFAVLIKELIPRSNILQKLKQYSKLGIKKKISKNLFDSTFYELKTAHYYSSKGFTIQFIKEKPTERRPDFKIMSKQGYAFVECKKKRTSSINGVIRTIDDAYLQLESTNQVGLICMELFFETKNFDSQNFFDKIQLRINKLPLVQFVVVSIENIETLGEKVIVKTKTRTLENPYCLNEIPKDIIEATVPLKPPKQQFASLLSKD